jgi:hypothetical protein
MSVEDPSTADLLALSKLDQKDRIQILLAEYAATRTELVARTGYGFQVFGFLAVVLTWAATQAPNIPNWLLWPTLFAIVVGFLILDYVNSRDLRVAAEHMKKLEHEINSRAGEYLLRWETQHSIYDKTHGLLLSYFRRRPQIALGDFPKLDPTYLTKSKVQ